MTRDCQKGFLKLVLVLIYSRLQSNIFQVLYISLCFINLNLIKSSFSYLINKSQYRRDYIITFTHEARYRPQVQAFSNLY